MHYVKLNSGSDDVGMKFKIIGISVTFGVLISVSWRSSNSQALEITSSLDDLCVMFICLKNTFYRWENQQVLRLRCGEINSP